MDELTRSVTRSGSILIVVALTATTLGMGACKKGPSPEQAKPEALMNLRRLADSAVNYFQNAHVNARGDILPRAFPRSVALTPPEVPCGEPYESQDEDWSQMTWEDLTFRVSDPQYYSYQFDSTGTGLESTFTVSAFGNLDCDDVYSTFVRVGRIEGTEVQISDVLSENEDE